MTWQILTLISVLTYSVSVLFQRTFLKDKNINPVAFSILFQFTTGLIILFFALVYGFKIPDISHIILNLILMVVFYGVGNIFLFKALQTIEASAFTILFTTRTVWTIFAAFLFLGESLTTKQGIGTLLIIGTVILVSYKKKHFNISYGMGFALLASLAFGIAFTNDAYILRTFETRSYVSLAFILPALTVWILNPKITGSIKVLINKSFIPKFFLLCLCYAISAITIFTAFSLGGTASLIAPLNQITTIVTVLLAMIFLKEKNDPVKKIVGAVLSFIGILLIL